MKKRVYAFLLALVMLCSAVPMEAFAAPGGGSGGFGGSGGGYGDVYGTDLGWEYAYITNKTGGGYNLYNPQSNSSYPDYSSHVNVTFGGTAVAEGYAGIQDETLVSGSATIVEITCDYGYYISAIVLACAHSAGGGGGRPGSSGSSSSQGDPFQCNTAASDNAYALAEPGSTLNDVRISLGALYEWAHHMSSVDDYFLMIQVAPLPDTLYVGYDSGEAGGVDISARPVAETGTLADGGVQNASYPTWGYPKGTEAPHHTALGISPEAEAEAEALGYAFAGWKLEYYTTYDADDNTFAGQMTLGGTKLPAGTDITVRLHAKLTAIWQPLTVIEVTKVWDDANDQDGLRPDSITVNLLQNGTRFGTPVTLDESNNWTASWTVPQLDVNGNPVTYGVEETVPNGYICTVTGSAADGFVLTNSHDPETVVVNVQKVWNDDNDRDGIRPNSVTVQLVKNGTPVAGSEVILTADSIWTHQWTGLEKNQPKANVSDETVANVYTVQEIGTADGYTVQIVRDASVNLVEVVNIHTPDLIDIPVEKIWVDANNQDNKRPGSVTVTLFANGVTTGKSLTLTAEGEWKGIFEDVYENANSEPIVYSLEENAMDGYTVAITGSAAEGFTVTNTHEVEQTSVSFHKIWDDNDDQDGIRPDGIIVTLYADGVAVDTATVSAAENWAGVFEGLTKYRIDAEGNVGVEIQYTVAETGYVVVDAEGNATTHTGTPDGYTAKVEGTTIINTHTPETANLSVTKVWGDNNNQDGKRPYAVVVTLYANGTATDKTLTLGDVTGLSGSWSDMPRFHNGQRISYTVVETGYYATEADYLAGNLTAGSVPGYTVTHHYDTSDPENPAATVTNSYTPLTTGINVQKVWDDADNQDGIRPGEITVTLWRKVGSGEWEATARTAVMSPENEWDVSFSGLPQYENGQQITYNVVEDAVAGYETVYDYDASIGVLTITNTHIPEQTGVSVTKVWNDNDNQDGIRPAKDLTVKLLADDVDTGKTAVLTYADGTWSTASFTGLNKYVGGREIVYTVVEEAVNGYTASYAVSVGTNGTEIVVTNTHIPEEISISVDKTWVDDNNRDGIRPAYITVNVYKGEGENKILAATHDLTAAEGWAYVFEGLDKFENGVEITYSVEEAAVAGYTGNAVVNADGSVSITNTHVPETTYVVATKVWNDANDQDGVRPASITLHLLADGDHTGQTRTVTAADDWKVTWTDLDKFADGVAIVYTVTESSVTGYTITYSHEVLVDTADKEYTQATITNTHTPEQTSVTVEKLWDDADNQDGIRPLTITVELYADGVATGKSLELTEAGGWIGTFTGLDKNKDGEKITYSVVEADVAGYTPAYSTDTFTGNLEVTNKHVPATVDASVTKVWNDAGNQDGTRPYAVAMELYANSQPTGTIVKVTDGTATVSDLPKYASGMEIVYSFVEVGYYQTADGDMISGVPAGYTASTEGTTVTNTHVPETISVPATKLWDDADNQDGIRPEEIIVTLYADGTAIRTLSLRESNNWMDTFDNLPKYKAGEQGIEVVYTVEETGYVTVDAEGNTTTHTGVPGGYTASVSGTTITNTHTPETTNLNVEKVWDDADNQDGKRPYAVAVTLYENGKATTSMVVLTEANGWSGSWQNMPRFHNGQRISYTIVETGYYATEADYLADKLTAGSVPGYTVTHHYDAADIKNPVATVTNSYDPETTSLNVQKVWDDADNQDGIRPGEITVTLWQKIGEGAWTATGQTAVLNPANEWDADFTGLPVYQNGQKITYNVVEDTVTGYTTDYVYDAAIGVVTVTNTHETATTEVSVAKNWNDADDQDGIRPDSVTVELYANGVATGKTQTLSEANGWSYTWTELDKFYHGIEIRYSVVEAAVDGYTTGYGRNPEGTQLTVNNTHIPETISIPVVKVWDDENNQDGIRPDEIIVTLNANGVATTNTLTLTADGNWHNTFVDLPKYAGGVEITYSVTEAVIPGYNGGETITVAVVDGVITVTNVHTPDETKLTVRKIWDDGDNQDGTRPATITLHLLANGEHMGESYKVTIDAEDGWTYTWTGLPKNVAGKEIRYTVYEEPVHSAREDAQEEDVYIATYARDEMDPTLVTVTNTYDTEVTAVNVQKVWHDDADRDDIRPTFVTVQLLGNGTAVAGSQVVLNADNLWTYQWTGIPKYEDGQAIEYTVEEIEVPDGYSVEVVKDSSVNLVEVINTHTPETMDIPVQKIWEDADNRDGKRPAQIVVKLYANGVYTGKALTLTGDSWKGTFEDVLKYENGVIIAYTVEEETVPDGYTASVDNTTHTITNTHVPEQISVPFTKVWDDENNQDGIRPGQITVTLYADGAAIDSQMISAAENWAGSFDNLPKYKAGEQGVEIVYTVKEEAVSDGYTASVNNTTNTITNTHVPATLDLTVTKAWNDGNNQDGKRPYAVVITLYANGLPTSNTVTLGDTLGLSGTWTGMPQFHNGQRISYTVVETGYYATQEDFEAHKLTAGSVPGYVVTHSYDYDNAQAVVTNTYAPETTAINVQKVWNDADNQDGIRPAQIKVTLWKQVGEGQWTATGQTAILNPANEWDADFTNLPKYENGQKITYNVVEDATEGYTTAYDFDETLGVVTIINTHTPATTGVSVTKVWEDADNQDGMRPTSITVELYANSLPTGKTAQIVYENGAWSTATFSNLDKYLVGHEIAYTVVETPVEGYTAEYSVTTAVDGSTAIVVTNTHTPETITIPVTKTWIDADNQDGKRPAEITVTLYWVWQDAQGNEVLAATGDTRKLNAANNWQAEFTDLDKFENGELIRYAVKESNVEGYTGTVVMNSDGTVSITNTHVPETTYVTAVKIWDDADNQDGKRPVSITLHLLANGVHTGDHKTVTAAEDWSATWTDLPKYAGGARINYTVTESAVDGYTVMYTDTKAVDDAGKEYIQSVIINSYTPAKTAVTVEKLWNDAHNQDGIRPISITVKLYADDVDTGKTLVLTEADGWMGTFTGLDMYRNGVEITYTVQEIPVDGYTPSYSEDTFTGDLEVINTHTPDVIDIAVEKVWDDAENQDGIRPGSATVTLYANGISTGKTLTLTAENSWKGSFRGVAKNDNGKPIVYSLVETAVSGYSVAISGNAADGFTVTNTHVPETTSVPVTKVWNDGDNQDGIRPGEITVTLYADGTAIQTMSLRASTNWSGSFKNLPKYSGGKLITYTVGEAEDDIPVGYTATVDGNTITNTHTPEIAVLNIRKSWGDNNNNDGKRPYAVVITLYVNGQSTGKSVVLSPENSWSGAWEDMPRYHNGQRISYSVVETGYYLTEADYIADNMSVGVAPGYMVTHDYDVEHAQAVVTNSYTPLTTSLNVQKVWNDADNQDGIRPEEITVTLWQKIGDGAWTATSQTAVLNAANEWDADFVGLPMYKDGKQILYNVVEDAVEGYTADYKYDAAIGVVTVTNTHQVAKTSVKVLKNWNDTDDQDGIRPDSVTVELYANGIATGRIQTLSEANDWSYTWTELDKFYHGTEIRYSVVEAAVEGYTTAYGRNSAGTELTVNNSHTPATISIPVYKIWEDADNQDGKRPGSITVTLMANDEPYMVNGQPLTMTLTAAENWHGTFTDLPKFSAGKEIRYTISEAAIAGYNDDQPITVEMVNGKISIVNVHEIELTKLTFVKIWDDNEDQDGERPDSITVHLLANGDHMGEDYKVTVDAEDGWTYTWTGLPKYSSGKEILYTVYEEPVLLNSAQTNPAERAADRYVATYVRDEKDPTLVTITNSYTPKTTVITAMKVWVDGDNRDGLRPESITVELYRLVEDKEEPVKIAGIDALILSEENGWIASWTDLPKFENGGKEIQYKVVETGVPDGYVSTVKQETEYAPGLFIITNSHEPEVTAVTVTKVWQDEENIEGLRLHGIIVQLRANASDIEGATAILNDDNRWTHTWTALGDQPLYVRAAGEVITYSVKEIGYVDADGNAHIRAEGENMPNGYEDTYTYSNNGYTVTITNTRAAEKTSIGAVKVWDDDDNNDGIRPESIDVSLYGNGGVLATVTLNEENDWAYAWKDLYVYQDGKEIVYEVKEAEVPDRYEVSYTFDSKDNIWTVTNTHKVETVVTEVTKVWRDNNDRSKLRPYSIDAQLYKNGVPYGEAIVLSEANDWTYEVVLPVYENGEKIEWTVKEVKVPNGYSVGYDQENLTIYNSINATGETPKTGDDSNIWMWSGMLGTSAMAMLAMLLIGKKKRSGKYAA